MTIIVNLSENEAGYDAIILEGYYQIINSIQTYFFLVLESLGMVLETKFK